MVYIFFLIAKRSAFVFEAMVIVELNSEFVCLHGIVEVVFTSLEVFMARLDRALSNLVKMSLPMTGIWNKIIFRFLPTQAILRFYDSVLRNVGVLRCL